MSLIWNIKFKTNNIIRGINLGEPTIPDREQEEALTDLLESIALEETAIAHLINAEAEKVQSMAKMMDKGKICFEDVIKFQKNMAKMMRNPIKKQILLQFKLEDILEFKEDLEIDKKKKRKC